MTCKKYAVDSGFIISPNDGEEHFVTASQVMRLHGVDPSECILVAPHNRRHLAKDRSLIWLFPRADGKYKQYNNLTNDVPDTSCG